MKIREELSQLIENVFKSLQEQKRVPEFDIPRIELEHPRDFDHGDYSSNICMKLAPILKLKPIKIGEMVQDYIQENKDKIIFIRQVEIAGPGFLNFYLSDDFFIKKIKEILNEKESYGDSELGNKKRVIVEHTAVNPNKAMHVGHIRNSILGDSISKILKKTNHEVQIENYIDDTGVQVADIVTALKYLGKEHDGKQKFDHFCWDLYTEIQKVFETDESLKEKKLQILSQMEEGNNEISQYAEEIVRKILKDQLSTLQEFGIYFDFLLTESSILSSGLWESTFEKMKKDNIAVYEESGEQADCWVVKDLDLPNKENLKNADKVLVTSNGNIVYTSKDIAHHLWKFGLLNQDFLYEKFDDKKEHPLWITSHTGEKLDIFGKCDSVYTVVDVRQSYSFDVIKAVFKKQGHLDQADALNHVAYGFVSLSKNTANALGIDTSDNRDVYAMSGRKGIGVKVDDLLNLMVEKVNEHVKNVVSSDDDEVVDERDIAIGAIKAYMLKFNVNSEVIFDFEEAMRMTGDSGPYLQYTHARIRGIIRKSDEIKNQDPNLSLLMTDEEKVLMKKLVQFPEIVNESSRLLSPNIIYNYLIELSQNFNTFYNKHSVLKADQDLKLARLALIDSVSIVLKNGLNLMGITAPEKM